MIVFILVVGLIAFLLILGYIWQKEERKNMPDDENYIEPKIEYEEDGKV